MENGYLLADTNSLVYAYRAGGPAMLDTFREAAKEQKREFAITKTVAGEIEEGPLRQELGRYIAQKNITIISTPKTEKQLEAGQIIRKNAGEISMLEVAENEHTAGRTTLIWSDDRYFRSKQNLLANPGVEPKQTYKIVDQRYEKGMISEVEYRKTRASYQQTVELFQSDSPSYSKALNQFDGPAPGFLDQLGVADARIAAKPGFQTFAKGSGAVGTGLMIYDAATTAQHYNALAAQGNQFGADALLHEYVGRTGGGLAGGFAAGAVCRNRPSHSVGRFERPDCQNGRPLGPPSIASRQLVTRTTGNRYPSDTYNRRSGPASASACEHGSESAGRTTGTAAGKDAFALSDFY